MRLTDLSIRKLTAPDKGQRTYYDDALPGFGIRVSQGGAKSFVMMYGLRRKLKTLGRYPDLRLADARREAKRLQVEIEGCDLFSDPTHEVVSFEDARERFLRDCSQRNRPRTVSDYKRLLERHFNFDQPIAEVSRRHVMGVVATLAQTPAEQQHAYVAARTMFNWCVRHGLIETSPLPRMTIATRSRDRVLSDAELAQVLTAARGHPYPFGPIIQLLVLTGQRRGEISALEWDWIDFDQDTISLPATLTKNRQAHLLPLADAAVSLLAALPRVNNYVFPARTQTGTVFNGWGKAKARFDKTLNGVDPYTLHDLRRTFSSTHAKIGTPIHVTEKLLNHISGTLSGVAAIYNRHSYAEEMRTAMQTYEAYLAKLIEEC